MAPQIVWRRSDRAPDTKRVVVTFANDTVVTNAFAPIVTQHSGVVVFTPPATVANQTYVTPPTFEASKAHAHEFTCWCWGSRMPGVQLSRASARPPFIDTIEGHVWSWYLAHRARPPLTACTLMRAHASASQARNDVHTCALVSTKHTTLRYFVYYLPYDQSGEGHITFAWDAPDNDEWANAASWATKAGTSAPQLLELPTPLVASRIRLFCLRTAKVASYQSFVREFRLRNGR
jgi:hypothetical protein